MRQIVSGILLCVLTLCLTSAEANWLTDKFKKDKQDEVVTYEAPPQGAMDEHCGPLREKLVELHSKPGYVQPFLMPRIAQLMRKYNHCKEAFMEQEFKYLKHVDVKPASEPAVNSSTTQTPSSDMP